MKKNLFIIFLISSLSSLAEDQMQNRLFETKFNDWKIHNLMSVGDHFIKNNYRFVGIPDGLGVNKENNSKIKIYMNHEIANDKGSVRSHGGKGAFISQWTLDLNSLTVISGEDLIKNVMTWNRDKKIFEVSSNENLNRLCSADLPEKSAFYNSKNKKGFDGRIFMSGEEDREGGRAFAHIISGKERGKY